MALHPALTAQGQHQNAQANGKGQQRGQRRTGKAEAVPVPHPEDKYWVQHQVEQAGEHHHQPRKACVAMSPEQAVAEVQHPAHPHGQHLNRPVGADQFANGVTGTDQGKRRGLQQPEQQQQHPQQQATTGQHQGAKPVGLILLAGTDGPGNQCRNGNADPHLDPDHQKRQRKGERLGRQRRRAQPCHKDTVDQVEPQ